MSRCNKCGRALSNVKSIVRKYGPTCWSKLSITENMEDYLEKGEMEDNNYPELIDYFNQLDNEYKCSCGEFLIKHGDIEHYEHANGYRLYGYKNRQWIFIVCPKCKISTSFKRLEIKEIR
jgi:hypothetical protein